MWSVGRMVAFECIRAKSKVGSYGQLDLDGSLECIRAKSEVGLCGLLEGWWLLSALEQSLKLAHVVSWMDGGL